MPIIRIVIGLVFVISAIAKLFPVELFEYQLVEKNLCTWDLSPIISRIIIYTEAILGLLIICKIYPRRVIPVAVVLLAVFTIYLFLDIIKNGNVGNCGCFGDVILLTPKEGILKNLFLLLFLIIILKFDKIYEIRKKLLKLMLPLIFLVPLISILVLAPFNTTSSVDIHKINYKASLYLLYDSSQADIPKINLQKGKHIVAFMSLTCPHCRIAATKLGVIKRKNPAIPLYFVLNGEKSKVQKFLATTNTTDIPHSLFWNQEIGWKWQG